MADFNQINQFGSAKPVRSGEGTSCAECEAMLMDALDGALTPQQHAAFDLHIATCAECGQMLADARRGASLLEMLKSPRPEPSALLLERILFQTSGSQTSGLAVAAKSTASGVTALPAVNGFAGAAAQINTVVPDAVLPSNVIPFRPSGRFNFKAIAQTIMQPRLAMTAAMAFFSITLTLNLTGVHISDLRASDLTPSNLKHSFYHANASVVRYYDNLRVVYELESRVNELKRDSDSDNAPAAAKPNGNGAADGAGGDKDKPKPHKEPKSGSGTSERRGVPGQEFKLAESTSDLRVSHPSRLCISRWVGSRTFPETRYSIPRPVQSNAALATPTNKLKEEFQEGDLV